MFGLDEYFNFYYYDKMYQSPGYETTAKINFAETKTEKQNELIKTKGIYPRAGEGNESAATSVALLTSIQTQRRFNEKTL